MRIEFNNSRDEKLKSRKSCVFWRIWPLILDQSDHLSERSDAGLSLYVRVARMSQGFSFSHRFSFQLETIGVMDDAIHNGVGKSGRGEPLVPVRDRDLSRQDR
jgi:hypothetical protein